MKAELIGCVWLGGESTVRGAVISDETRGVCALLATPLPTEIAAERYQQSSSSSSQVSISVE